MEIHTICIECVKRKFSSPRKRNPVAVQPCMVRCGVGGLGEVGPGFLGFFCVILNGLSLVPRPPNPPRKKESGESCTSGVSQWNVGCIQ